MNDRQQEYERLIAPIEDRMMRAVWRILRDPKDAEDALQEALLKVWKRWHRIRTHPNPHALVLQICIYAAHDVLRRKVRQGKWLEAVAIPEDIPDSSASVHPVHFRRGAERPGAWSNRTLCRRTRHGRF